MPTRDVVVIGASAGGFQPLYDILGSLTPDLPATVVIVIHTRSNGGMLPQLLSRRSGLDVEFATDDAPLLPGRVYVAPPDRHVVLTQTTVRVVRGPRENGFRPAIDPLFRSAARVHGAAVVGVILSGALDDGSYGLNAIVRRGGAALIQDPADAEVPSMPLAALRETSVDAVLPAAQIGPAIARLCGGAAAEDTTAMPRRDEPDQQRPGDETQVSDMARLHGPPSPITCPACGGALWENEENGVVRYACHVGHQYAPESLLADHGENVEQALWTAVRVLEQHADLRKRMASRAEAAGLAVVAEGFAADAREYHRQAQDVRRLVFDDRDAEPAQPATQKRGRAR